MTKELLISSSPHETKVAVLEDGQVVEVNFQRESDVGLVGGIYKGRVNRVLPGMQSAFVDIGLERDAFLYVSDFFEESEEYDRVFTDAENRVARMGGADAAPPAAQQSEPAPEISKGAVSAPDDAESPESAPAEASVTPQDVAPKPAESSPASSSQSGYSEMRKNDFGGRRRHRRGRRFRDFRSGGWRESPERPSGSGEHAAGGSHGLEPLPGESLANYSHAAFETPETAASPSITDSELPGEPAVDAASAIAPVSPSGPVAASDDIAATSPSSDNSGPDSIGPSPGQPKMSMTETSDREAPLPAQETSGHLNTTEVSPSLPRHGEKATDFLHEGRDAIEANRSFPSEELQEAELEPGAFLRSETASTGSQPDEEQAAQKFIPPDELIGSAPEPSTTDAEALAGSGAEGEPAAMENRSALASNAETDEWTPQDQPQSYTLRETQHRPRVAPRRPRRGRGRFRTQARRDGPSPAGRPESFRAGNQRSLPISELLKEGQEILVQIAKEPLGAKGARITSHIALPGRYLVFMPTITHIGVSRKITSEDERLRLRNVIIENKGSLSGGFIVRTAAAGRSDEELKADLAFLTHLWNEIRAKADQSKAPALLHRDLTLVERMLRDLLSPDFKCIRVDNEIDYEHIAEFVSRFQPSLTGQVKLYARDMPLFEEFGVQSEIDRALKPKIWLKSGGYIVINQTEALVAIDVNTGKYVGKTNRLEDTIVKTNIDAVQEIVRQIRLRDLGGIVVIDFIDMDERRNRAKVVAALEEALRRDRAPTKILSFNEFGLVALTRKRVKHSLERTLCDPCPYCDGGGWVKSVATVSSEVVAEARKMAAGIDGKTLHLRVSPEVASALKGKDGVLISEMEAATGKEVVIKSDAAAHQERFEIY